MQEIYGRAECGGRGVMSAKDKDRGSRIRQKEH